jgi:protein O-mannosyl-transferase
MIGIYKTNRDLATRLPSPSKLQGINHDGMEQPCRTRFLVLHRAIAQHVVARNVRYAVTKAVGGRAQSARLRLRALLRAGNRLKRKLMTRLRLIGLILALVTLAAYLPVRRNSFIVFDDGNYITENYMVKAGLTWAGVKWAFTTWDASNWHPLTWLSHMLDCELFGLNAGAHHLVNVLFHTANAVLLLLLLFRMTGLRGNNFPLSSSASPHPGTGSKPTAESASARQAGALWASALVAALFAWHPLHVESVAWAAERKDVLSTFFGLLSLGTYARYAQRVASERWQVTRAKKIAPKPDRPRITRHASLLYGLALLFFALGLMAKPMLVTLPFVFLLLDYWPLQRVSSFKFSVSRPGTTPSSTLNPQLPALVLEKWPFFLLTAISCVVTYLSQRPTAVQSLERYPLDLRVENTLLSYGRYLLKAIWPVDLAILYPLPKQLPWAEVGTATVALAIISWLVWRSRNRCPYLLVGWLWFVGTLVPVIGLVQVGHQAMADRYTYVPLIGIFVGVAYGMADLAGQSRFRKATVAVVGILMLGGCLLGMENQLRFWRDDETIFAHAVAVTKNNALAQLHFGNALQQQGRFDEALAQFQEVLRANPNNVEARLNVGTGLSKKGRMDEAIAQFQKALEIRPNFAEAHYSIGTVLFQIGRVDEAIVSFQKALEISPDYPDALCNLGAAFLQKGRLDDAVELYQKAVALQPDSAEAHNNLGYALLQKGHAREAIGHYETSLKILPDNPDTPNTLAWVLATWPEPSVRNGVKAVALAEQANRLSGGKNPVFIETLAAAYAETGRFSEAVKAAQQALPLANAQSNAPLVKTLQAQIGLYQAGQPFHETAQSTAPPDHGQP